MTFIILHHAFRERGRTRLNAVLGSLCAVLLLSVAAVADGGPMTPIGRTSSEVQPKIVKVYGAGGFQGLEPYQSGLTISSDGLILTVYSYVLDTNDIRVTLNDGRRFEATLVGADPALEVAVLKVNAENLPHFNLDQAVEAMGGERILAFSNLFGLATGGETVSVQHGVVSVKTSLDARRGTFQSPYSGSVYVLDAMTNNPGAAGGALVNRRGELVGMLGKELKSTANGIWLNYAVPIDVLRPSVAAIRQGKLVSSEQGELKQRPERSLTPAMLGLMMVPDVVDRTPPFVDYVRRGSPAAEAEIRPDDLVVFVGEQLIQSNEMLREELAGVDYRDEVTLTLMRDQELYEVVLRVPLTPDVEKP